MVIFRFSRTEQSSDLRSRIRALLDGRVALSEFVSFLATSVVVGDSSVSLKRRARGALDLLAAGDIDPDAFYVALAKAYDEGERVDEEIAA
jgi:hypothetical protein